jgi:hypothetical protein
VIGVLMQQSGSLVLQTSVVQTLLSLQRLGSVHSDVYWHPVVGLHPEMSKQVLSGHGIVVLMQQSGSVSLHTSLVHTLLSLQRPAMAHSEVYWQPLTGWQPAMSKQVLSGQGIVVFTQQSGSNSLLTSLVHTVL